MPASTEPTKRKSPEAARERRGADRPSPGWAGLSSSSWPSATLAYIASKAWSNPILFLQNLLDGLKLGFVYALIALGYTMVYGIVKLINFAHGDVFMVGAFTSFYAVSRFSLHQWPQAVFPGIDARPLHRHRLAHRRPPLDGRLRHPGGDDRAGGLQAPARRARASPPSSRRSASPSSSSSSAPCPSSSRGASSPTSAPSPRPPGTSRTGYIPSSRARLRPTIRSPSPISSSSSPRPRSSCRSSSSSSSRGRRSA